MIRTAACVIAAALIAPAALAVPVAPNSAVVNPAGQAPSIGVSVAPTLVQPFVTPTFSGTLTSDVYVNDPQNPYGPGMMTFHYVVSNDALSANAIQRLTVNDYVGWFTDMTWQVPGAMSPAVVNRDLSGDVIGFVFAGFVPGHTTLNPGLTSMVLVVHTNAPNWQPTLASVIDGFTATVPSYAPVPTPGAGALLGAGLFAAARRRRA